MYKYAYDLVSNVIDYRGDIEKYERTGVVSYSEDFSPNNIRRLIISGDGVQIDFHVSVDNRLNKRKVFSNVDRSKIMQAIQLENYKPMIWALSDRVCSSVEEVIICLRNSTNIPMGKELDISGLVGKKIGTGVSKRAILDRYKRLAYMTIVDCDIQTLVTNDEVRECTKPFKLISETNFVRDIGKIEKFNEDWFLHYGTTSAYSFDNLGSRLNNHFKSLRIKYENEKKSNELESYKEKRYAVVNEKFERVMRNYKGVYESIKKLSVITMQGKKNYICKYMELLNFSNLKLCEPNSLEEEFKKNPSDEKVNQMVALYSNAYSELCSWFFKQLLELKMEYPITAGVILNNINRTIVVSPNAYVTMELLGKEFQGKSISDSTSNICSYACMFFMSKVDNHNIKKYCSKEEWMKNFR